MSSSTSSSDRCIENFLRCLSRHDPNILISTPNDSCYLSDLQRSIQNLRFCATRTPKVRRPQVIVTPLKESHVQAAVICSKECNLQMKIRSNGHDYEGLSYVSDVPFVVLDMLKLNNVEIDVKEDIAHNLPDELYLKVLFQREKASQKEGSFKIKATFQAFFLGETKQLLSIMEQWFPQLGVKSEHCKEMSWIHSTLYSSSLDPNGPLEILLERTLDNPKFETELTRTRRMFFKSASDYVKAPLSESALEGIWKIFIEYPSVKHPYMLWSPSGGALGRVEPSRTPYPQRKNLYLIEYMVSWVEKGTEVADTNLTWLRRLYRYMEPYVSKAPREAYFNFRDLDLGRSKNGTTGATYDEAKVWGVKYFMGNFDRLVKVKNKVDPGNLFRSEQSRAHREGYEQCLAIYELVKLHHVPRVDRIRPRIVIIRSIPPSRHRISSNRTPRRGSIGPTTGHHAVQHVAACLPFRIARSLSRLRRHSPPPPPNPQRRALPDPLRRCLSTPHRRLVHEPQPRAATPPPFLLGRWPSARARLGKLCACRPPLAVPSPTTHRRRRDPASLPCAITATPHSLRSPLRIAPPPGAEPPFDRRSSPSASSGALSSGARRLCGGSETDGVSSVKGARGGAPAAANERRDTSEGRGRTAAAVATSQLRRRCSSGGPATRRLRGVVRLWTGRRGNNTSDSDGGG
ncbi:hypothetical protein Scep_030060 [Stephania cephalantha]|uniref:FAD-binding PCMH-type domain-containing protein n=1 Tax=Stephania cephalantha TaxID=152367 RepID=A0AAP0E6K7_9MAGN